MNIYGITNDQNEFLSKDEVNQLLLGLGVSEEVVLSGDVDAIKEDAEKNNIDLSKLSEIAREPKDEIKGSNDTAKEDYEQELLARGIPNNVIVQGQAAIQAFADKMLIKLPDSSGTNLNLKF